MYTKASLHPSPTELGDEVNFNKLLKCLERKMLCQPRRFFLACFQKKGVHRASSSASEWWLEPARASICPCQRIQGDGGARGRCNREGTMLHQLVNMSLGCSCGSQEQSQEMWEGGRGKRREEERNGRDERFHASAAFIPVMRRALSN